MPPQVTGLQRHVELVSLRRHAVACADRDGERVNENLPYGLGVHEELLTLVDGVRLTPTQRRIAQCLLEHASKGRLSQRRRGRRPGRRQPAVGHPVRDRARLRRLSGAAARAPEHGRAGASDRRRSHNDLQHAIAAEIDNLQPTRRPARRRRTRSGRRRRRRRSCSPPPGRCRWSGSGPPRRSPAYFGYFAAKVLPDVRVTRSWWKPAHRSAGTGARGRCDRDAGDCASALSEGVAGRAARGARGRPRRRRADRLPDRRGRRPRRRHAARRRRLPARLRPARRADGAGDGAAAGHL